MMVGALTNFARAGTTLIVCKMPHQKEVGLESEASELTALADLASAGDSDALESLLAQLYPIVRTFIGRRIPARDLDGDDLVQSSMIRVWMKLPQCRATSDRQLLHWCRVIAWRITLDHFRHPRRGLFISLAEPLAEPTPGDDSPGKLILAMAAAWPELPEATQKLIWAKVIEGRSWSEIAEEQGTTVSAAKRRFQRAQKRLRSHAGRLLGEEL